MQRVDDSEIETMLGKGRYQLARQRDELQRQQGKTRLGQEFYPILALLMSLLLATGVDYVQSFLQTLIAKSQILVRSNLPATGCRLLDHRCDPCGDCVCAVVWTSMERDRRIAATTVVHRTNGACVTGGNRIASSRPDFVSQAKTDRCHWDHARSVAVDDLITSGDRPQSLELHAGYAATQRACLGENPQRISTFASTRLATA